MADQELETIRQQVEQAVIAADVPSGLEYLAAMENIHAEINKAAEEAITELINKCIAEDDVLVLRRGKTGKPEAVMLTYAAYQEFLQAAEQLAELQDGSRRQGGHSD